MKRVGIMGGTFDPIHIGHLMLGKQAYEEYEMDQIWYMPSGMPPHKKDHAITNASHRCHMVRLAIEDFPYMELSEFEIKRGAQNTYTADTLKLLHMLYPNLNFYFIIGEDSLFQIERWYHPREIMKTTTLMVASRDCGGHNISLLEQIAYLEKKYSAKILLLHCPKLNISSIEIRSMIENGKDVSMFLPKKVETYILDQGLYRFREKDAWQ